jgi:hypothetical protein
MKALATTSLFAVARRDRKPMKASAIAALLAVAMLAGCRGRMTTIRLTNSSAGLISTIIVDYPSATFGKDRLAPGEVFSSSVKVTDTGPLTVQFSDAKGAHHKYTGPILRPDIQKDIEIKLTQENATATIR